MGGVWGAAGSSHTQLYCCLQAFFSAPILSKVFRSSDPGIAQEGTPGTRGHAGLNPDPIGGSIGGAGHPGSASLALPPFILPYCCSAFPRSPSRQPSKQHSPGRERMRRGPPLNRYNNSNTRPWRPQIWSKGVGPAGAPVREGRERGVQAQCVRRAPAAPAPVQRTEHCCRATPNGSAGRSAGGGGAYRPHAPGTLVP